MAEGVKNYDFFHIARESEKSSLNASVALSFSELLNLWWR